MVQGAKNVISACQECRVRCLIYNDSVDVVDGGLHDIHDGDEWLVSTWKTNNTLNDLKAQVEALILSANDIDGVLTCSLRPSNVFGLGDPEFVPYFLKLSRYGFSKISPFSENVTHAYICAEEALNFQKVFVAGKKQSFKNYFDDAKEFQRSFKMNFKDEESKMSSKRSQDKI
ncbi:3beta-hydroxysteroid-dehydrogenase/decarboxylase isoform 3 [Glycine max]|uniref:3beta-hydroxysteroid- dehydrogenase/decarboxylase-like n=1 Tax=Glycine soja TaxID=3848 RepID=UPI00104097F2|nr:3beta-hydroxysteroid-dehydrogenase/decarboxylase-like [Glycine soja]KAH1232415.1 3beta-hydroxysteroid-dehydrogenase/decarboxylase isoform 3 [Glycine max]